MNGEKPEAGATQKVVNQWQCDQIAYLVNWTERRDAVCEERDKRLRKVEMRLAVLAGGGSGAGIGLAALIGRALGWW